ncbi:MAG: prolyl-tRNA synthetase [Sulfobacillus acidophilus]|uniref:Prolyl-tRNA synthetase n=1 Tax=Sulfobacillus acidophilus TaxID=53633 RepID=A0A2T2WEU6_9FIRM|nr:MAG: prolyl-tRNA synthetase [Sulfobacillus acidophilus]
MPIDIEFPFLDMIASGQIPLVDRRQLHYLTRGVHQAAERLKANIQQMVEVSVYWCGARPVVVLHTPLNRPDLNKLEAWFGFDVRPASPTEISALCGTHIYGSPPAGQSYQMPIFIDDDLMRCPFVWAAAGDPAVWVAITPENLVRVTGGYVVDIKRPNYTQMIEQSRQREAQPTT